MSARTKLFLAAMGALGFGAVAYALAKWRCDDPARFVAYLLIGVAASAVRVPLPGTRGATTGAFLVLMCALAEMSQSEAVIAGVLSALFNTFWRPKSRPTAAQALFNVSNIAFARSSAACSLAALVAVPGVKYPVAVVVAAMVYFVVSTMPLAMVASLTEGGRPFERWRKSESWLSVHYLAGASVAVGVHYGSSEWGWPVVLLVLPVVHLYGLACRARLAEPERRPSMQLAPPRNRGGASAILQFRGQGESGSG